MQTFLGKFFLSGMDYTCFNKKKLEELEELEELKGLNPDFHLIQLQKQPQ
jgi:hypothetical protein